MNSKNKKLRVCLIAPSPPPNGGIATWTSMILRYISAQETNVEISRVNTALRWRAIHQQGILRRLVGGTLQFFCDYFTLLVVLFRHRPDVIHLTTVVKMGVIKDIIFILTGRIFRRKTVYHIRNSRILHMSEKKTISWRLFCVAAYFAASVVILNDQTFHVMKKHFPDKDIRKIPNCINTDELECCRQPKSDHDNLIFIFIGLVIPAKGIEELLDAWCQINPSGAELKIYGDFGEEYQRQLRDKYPIQLQHIEFYGETEHSQAMSALRNADVLVLPSYLEGFPNVVLEAMVLETPVIATEVGAIPEMLADERGLLIPPQNVPSLANAMSNFMENAELRKRCAANAKAYAMEHYTIEVVFQQLYQLWASVSHKSCS